METNVIYNEDCIKGMKERIPDNSVDLIVTDPPYNIGKAEWDKIDNYIEWSGEWIIQCERVLKNNGSFYFFHNDFEVIAKLQNWIKENTNLKFKRLITMNKPKVRKYNWENRDKLEAGWWKNVINWYQTCEYVLFYTNELNRYKKQRKKLKEYTRYMRKKLNELDINLNKLNKKFGYKAGCNWWFSKKQPRFINETDYKKLKELYPKFNLTYTELKDKVKNIESVTFNVSENISNVWSTDKVNSDIKHPTVKPINIIKKIIKHSSNENDIVLDCFGGSGTTAKACQNLNRQYILFETNEDYVKLTKDRLRQQSLFEQAK